MSTSFRLEKDSSNDAEMFEDSSGEGSDATCGLKDNGKPTASASKKGFIQEWSKGTQKSSSCLVSLKNLTHSVVDHTLFLLYTPVRKKVMETKVYFHLQNESVMCNEA